MALTGLTEVQFTNLNVTGVATFAQSVGIAGTLTYEDVANVDAVGLITARSGVSVSGGQVSVGAGTSLHSTGLDLGTGNITGHNLKSTGIITATSFSGSGANLTGVLKNIVEDTSPQLGGNLDTNGNHIDFADNNQARFGNLNTGDLYIYHDSSDSYINNVTGTLYTRGDTISLNAMSTTDKYLQATNGGAVELYYDNVKKFETLADGAVFDGDGVSEIKISDDGDGFDATGGAAVVAKGYFDYSGSVTGFYTDNAGRGVIGTKTSQEFHFIINNSRVMHITQNGYLVPASNNAKDLGTSSLRWRNIYTNDLNLSNKGSTNSVDNTWGDYTIQEGESDLFLINNRSGKKYKFNLTEVS